MWQLSDSWPNQFQNNLNLTWPSNTAGISVDSRLEYSKIMGMLKCLHSLGSCAENFLLIQISYILSVIFTRLWLKCQSVLMGRLHLSKACWELWLSDDQPHSDYDGQWQRALCILAVLQSSQPNPQRNEKSRKMYAIKQVKICAEYWDMLPRPRLDLSGAPGLRPIGLSPGSWQTSLGLGSMSRYSAQILICITFSLLWSTFVVSWNFCLLDDLISFSKVLFHWVIDHLLMIWRRQEAMQEYSSFSTRQVHELIDEYHISAFWLHVLKMFTAILLQM